MLLLLWLMFPVMIYLGLGSGLLNIGEESTSNVEPTVWTVVPHMEQHWPTGGLHT